MTEPKTIDTDETTVVVDERKVTWSYSRKRNLGNYQSEDVGIYLTDHAPASTKNMVKWVADKSDPVFTELKTQVWTALGLSFSFSELGIPELDEESVALVPSLSAPAPVQPQFQASGTPVPLQPRPPGQTPSFAQVGYYADEPGFCKDCGAQGLAAFYDNRLEVDQKMQAGQKIGPDFKCKTCQGGNGKGKPLYRPGSFDYNQSVGGQAAASMTPPSADPF